MKRVLPVALVLLLGLTAFAGRYFVGCEVVPHTFGTATYGRLYALVGYDAGLGFAKVGLSSPLTIDGWYMVSAGGSHSLTPSLAIRGGFTVWGEMKNFAFVGGTWTVGAGVHYKFDTTLAFFMNFNMPLQVNPQTPFFGTWISLGFTFSFGGGVEATK